MRRTALALLLAVPLALVPLALAQQGGDLSADDTPPEARYHAAAQAYVDGENETAVREAEAGLALDPDNEKLQRLLELLRQDQPPQDNSGEQDEQDPSGEEGDDEKQQSEDGQQSQNGERPESDDATQRDGTDQDTGEPEEGDASPEASGEQQRPPQQQGAAGGEPRPTQMSAAEAQRLLDAVGAEEELLVSRMRRAGRAARSDRDW